MLTESNTPKNIVWSGQNCPWCERVKALLDSKNIQYEVRQIGVNATKEEFFEANRGARTVPQVWLGGKLIGGFEQTKAALA